MPSHQNRQRRLVTTAEVVLQQLSIGQPCPVAQPHPAKVLDHLAHLAGRHFVSLVKAKLALYGITTRTGPFDARLFAEGRGPPANQPDAVDRAGMTAFCD